MKPCHKIILSIFSLLISHSLNAQQENIVFPTTIFPELTKAALSGNHKIQENIAEKNQQVPGASQMMCKMNVLKSFKIPANKKSTDTLIVTSDQTITGNYVQNGPIFIADNATLTIINANVTALGDIYLFGYNSQLIVDSSTIYSPQQYFYQRTLGVTQNGKVHIHNSTLDFSGLSHNVFATDSADIEMINVTKNGWATNGFWGNAKFYMDNCNQAGEYIIIGNIDLKFKNTKTILLWHQFPDTAVINYAFPAPDTVYNYIFNNNIPGIDGIEYNVEVDTCYDVMWAIMPTTNSDVTLSNSTIRAIGVWFEGNDTLNVNGLVNNSTYSNFIAPLSDRHLQLINSKVQTWSLYPMTGTNLNITGCIVGEIGAMGHSSVYGQNIFVDGSGGYFWSNDTTLTVAAFTSTSSYVRSERNGIFIYAYSSIVNGYPSALGTSVMIVMQSNVPQPPIAYDGSAAWYGFIEQPFDTYIDTIVAITGSAWIERGPICILMEFKSYHVYYQKAGETVWTEITCDSLNQKYDDTLALWNTAGLAAGQYNVKLVIRDTWGWAAEGVKSVNVMPQILVGLSENSPENNFIIFPNPAVDFLNLQVKGSGQYLGTISIKDITGKTVLKFDDLKFQEGKIIQIPVNSLCKGMYELLIRFDEEQIIKKFTVK
ncbi:MAG: T9SS type A sorting domain-containing protein [Bacteroidota bacterium]